METMTMGVTIMMLGGMNIEVLRRRKMQVTVLIVEKSNRTARQGIRRRKSTEMHMEMNLTPSSHGRGT